MPDEIFNGFWPADSLDAPRPINSPMSRPASISDTVALHQFANEATPALAVNRRLRAEYGHEGMKESLRTITTLACSSAGIRPDVSHSGNNRAMFRQKRQLAAMTATIYASEIRPRWHLLKHFRIADAFADGAFTAADNVDANVGILSGTILGQRILDLYKYQYEGVMGDCFTLDFSDEPAVMGQTLACKIPKISADQEYDSILNVQSGLPNGFSIVANGPQFVDAPVILSNHRGVPIRFTADTVAAFAGPLFDMLAGAAAYAMVKTWLERIFALFTPANFNAYSTAAPPKVPIPYVTFPVAQQAFGGGSLALLDAAFTSNEVPLSYRRCLVLSSYFASLENNPGIVAVVRSQIEDEAELEQVLPKKNSFLPLNMPDLLAQNATPNLVGMALHKAGIVAVMRPPASLNDLMEGVSVGRTVLVTNPDSGQTMLLVEHVRHDYGFVEYRPECLTGQAVGDGRGGLCITSQ